MLDASLPRFGDRSFFPPGGEGAAVLCLSGAIDRVHSCDLRDRHIPSQEDHRAVAVC